MMMATWWINEVGANMQLISCVLEALNFLKYVR